MKTKIFIGVVLFLVIGWVSQYVSGLKEAIEIRDVAISGLSSDLSVAKATINHMNDENARINKLNEANSRKIQTLINISAKELENVKNAIKDNKCVNVTLPADAVNILHNKASSIRKPTNTKQSNSALPATVTE